MRTEGSPEGSHVRPLLWDKDPTRSGLLTSVVPCLTPGRAVTATDVPADALARAEWLPVFRVFKGPVHDRIPGGEADHEVNSSRRKRLWLPLLALPVVLCLHSPAEPAATGPLRGC